MGGPGPQPGGGAPHEVGGGNAAAELEQTFEAEWAYLRARRAAQLRAAGASGVPDTAAAAGQPSDTVGLSLSGGGIRSAAFALGVVQQLADAGILAHVDYLSTVSGGGFLGGAILTHLHSKATSEKPPSGTGPVDFPLRRPDPCKRETEALLALRRHASYLAREGVFSWSGFVMTANYVYGFITNLLYLVGASVALMGLWVAAASYVGPPPMLASAGIFFAVWLAGAAWHGWRRRRAGLRDDPTGPEEAARRESQREWFASCVSTFLLLWFVAGVTELLESAAHLPPSPRDLIHSVATLNIAAPIGLAGVLKVAAFVMQRDWKPQALRAARQAGIQLTALLIALAVSMLAVLAVLALADTTDGWPLGRLSRAPFPVRALAASGAGLALLLLASLARSTPEGLGSLHDFYKDRIAAAFTGGEAAGDIPLADLANPADPRMPFPIINTTINLPRSPHGERRDPGSLFTLTPRHCGSNATGYRPTRSYAAGALTLADAIATSGSAISPRMGVYTQPMLSFILGFLNLRLGMLVPNPARQVRWRFGTLRGLPTEWFQFRFKEDSLTCYLSDGGHYDNLGVMALLRRHCELLIVVDAEADPARSFQGLASAVRRARVQDSIEVKLDTEDLLPDPQTGMSLSPCAVGTIRYEERSGVIVYLKPSLTKGLSADLRHYHDLHPNFPHQGTANQFFSDPQFEAYRALGWQCSELAFGDVRVKANDGQTLREPFEQLRRRWRKAPRVSEALFRAMEQSIAVEAAMLREPGPLHSEREIYPELLQGISREDVHLALMQMRLMDEAFLAGRLDLYADLPENAGWLALMERYARSATFGRIWARAGEMCSEGFQYFCYQRFGLERPRARPERGAGEGEATAH